jgi:hypothetical protein
MQAIGLDLADLFDDRHDDVARTPRTGRPRRVGVYEYVDRMGEPLARKVRLEPKSFLWEVPNRPGGWRKARKGEGNPAVLYRLPEILEADHVQVNEGEKAADALVEAGHCATCSPTTRWTAELAEPLRDKAITIWADRDEPGLERAQKVLRMVQPIAASVRIVQSRVETQHADAFDHLKADHPVDQAVEINFDQASSLLAVRAADVEVRAVEWLWTNRIPRGKPVVLDGAPGLAKSTITIDLAARITTARSMPDGTPGIAGAVILISYEDDPGDTIVPRLLAAGGDPSKLFLADTVQSDEGPRPLELPLDVDKLELLIGETGAVLLVVDPLMAGLGADVRTNVDHHVRRALAPIKSMAERTGVAVLVVRHLNKMAKVTDPVLRGGASIGIIGFARAGLIVARDPDDPDHRLARAQRADRTRSAGRVLRIPGRARRRHRGPPGVPPGWPSPR